MSFPYDIKPDPTPLGATANTIISVSADLLVRTIDGTSLQYWNLAARTYKKVVSGIDIEFSSLVNFDIANDGTVYFFGAYSSGLSGFAALYSVATDGSVTRADSTGPLFAGPTRVFDVSGGKKILTATAGCVDYAPQTGYLDNGVPVLHTQTSMDFCLQADGNIAGLFEPVGSSNAFTIKSITGTAFSYTVTGLVTRAATDEAMICHVNASHHWLVVTDGKFYLINDYSTGSPGTIKASGAFSALFPSINFPRKNASATNFWAEFDNVSTATGLVTSSVNSQDWVATDTYQGVLYDPVSNALVSHPQLEQELVWRFLASAPAPPPPSPSTIRAWAFSLDGHDFYGLKLGTTSTLVFDRTTKQWSEWSSPSLTYFRISSAMNWQGMTAALVDGGTDIVAGDDTAGVLYRLDPTRGRDDTTTTGDAAFTRIITGSLPVDGRQTMPCDAVQITLSLGNPSQLGASITLQTSDDLGHNWTNHGTVTMAAGNYSEVVEWRSLGLMRQPGRLFQISDNGAAVRIGRAQLR